VSSGLQASLQAAGHVVWAPDAQPPWQSAVHAHELLQSIPLEQLLCVPQVAMQVPVPHRIPVAQLMLPRQVAVQSTLSLQLIPLLHVFDAEQIRSHVVAEQITGDWHVPDASQLILQSSPVHDTPLEHVFGAVQ
jgi:hypothetical protein